MSKGTRALLIDVVKCIGCGVCIEACLDRVVRRFEVRIAVIRITLQQQALVVGNDRRNRQARAVYQFQKVTNAELSRRAGEVGHVRDKGSAACAVPLPDAISNPGLFIDFATRRVQRNQLVEIPVRAGLCLTSTVCHESSPTAKSLCRPVL